MFTQYNSIRIENTQKEQNSINNSQIKLRRFQLFGVTLQRDFKLGTTFLTLITQV